jgi:hypothetical protein
MSRTTRIRRTAVALGAAAAVAALAAPAGAATLTVKSSTLGCCTPSTATSIAWSVSRAVTDTEPAIGDVVVTRAPDSSSFLFFRATATGAPIDSVVYDTPILRYCLTGGRKVRMDTGDDGNEKLTFAGFTGLKIYVPGLKAGWGWLAGQPKGTTGIC